MVESLSRSAPAVTAVPVPLAKGAAPSLPQEIRDKLRAARESAAVLPGIASQRKALARENVERLKQQLDKLAMIAALDPKGMARVLKAMMKQLAAAVRDYALSGDPRELRAEMDRVEASARTVEGAPPAPRPAAETARLEAADKAAEDKFLAEVRQLRRRMEILFGNAVGAALAKDGRSRDLERTAAGFDDDRAVLLDNEKAIAGWSRLGPGPAFGAVDMTV